jgi:hypothetical protein
MKELYKFFAYNGKVVDITDFDKSHLKIFSREVLKMISDGVEGWEKQLPEGIAEIIKNYKLFGYDPNKILQKV